jgi:two-component system, sensor histidine kinase PdtaS
VHSHLTDCGLPGIAQIPFGVHICNFYRTREELAAALVPFFLAGLRAKERCIWITAEPLLAVDAIAALEEAGLDARAEIERGSLVVRDFSDWYAEAGTLLGAQVVDLWLGEEARALADGYRGLRITGNVTFLQPEEWPLFMEYEELVNRAFHGRRIVTLCTYWLEQCGSAETLEVLRRHNGALDRPDEGWQILTQS